MLELAILGLLHEAPAHGYELRKQLGLRLGGFRLFSYGSLYPALRRLTRSGLIESVHSFAQNLPIAYIFLGFLSVFTLICAAEASN